MLRYVVVASALLVGLGVVVTSPARAQAPVSVCTPSNTNNCLAPNSDGSLNSKTADGGATTIGTTTDAACSTDNGTCTAIALLKRIAQRITTAYTSIVLQAGTAIVGKVGLDQTTDGTTNAVRLLAETTKVIGTVNQGTSPWVISGAVTNAGTFATQATLPTTPLIASGNGVVLTPVTEAASAVAPSTAVAAAESCRVLQASAANLYKVTVAIAATTGYVMIFNATSAPGDGAVSPAWPAIRIVSDGTSGWADLSFNPPLRLGTGATVCFSSTGPFTKTASATASIGGLVK